MAAAPESPTGEPLGATGYLAAEGFERELARELGFDSTGTARLLFVPGPPRPAAWAANIWFEPVRIPIASIGEGANALRAIQRSWALFSTGHHGRAKLIQERLPHVSAKPLVFPQAAPAAPLGSWTLADPNTIIAAARCSSPFPNGEMNFVEDRSGPPSRAYLKLWEALTRLGRYPKPGETCIDLGASPGGWTWVIQSLGARVVAVDKAPLDPAVTALPNVEVREQSAFALAPDEVGPVDWLFSDIICYPERLLRLVNAWIDSGRARNLVCTIKFQGETDFAAQAAFAAIPGAQVFHLHQNKHELTFARLVD
jgi:23S rRNA (cytidine2498-2'-O)-methyltransferase